MSRARERRPTPQEGQRNSRPRVNRRSTPSAPAVPLRDRLRLARERLTRHLGRLRWAANLAAKALLLAAVGAAAFGAVRLVERHVRTSPAFATAVLEVHGLSRLERQEVLSQAGLSMGRNVFDVSPEQARKQLQEHPWIESAEITRRLPGTYRIRISERRAVALLSMDDLYLVAQDGTVFKRLQDGDPFDLPVITGMDARDFGADPELRASVLMNAVSLLDDYSDVGLWRREPIAEIHVEPDLSTSLYVGADGTHVRLGKPPFRAKLRRLRQILDKLQTKKTRAAYVLLDNLRRPDRVTVRLR